MNSWAPTVVKKISVSRPVQKLSGGFVCITCGLIVCLVQRLPTPKVSQWFAHDDQAGPNLNIEVAAAAAPFFAHQMRGVS